MTNDAFYKKMTTTPVHKLIISLSIPTILSMLVTNVYNLVDTAFVGRLGTSASGAVGIVFGFMSILQAVGFMFGQGSGSMVSRTLGKQDPETASKIASTGFFSAFAIAAIVEVICFIFIKPLVMVLGSTETIAPYAITYISYILYAAPFVASSFTLNNILRYEGKAKLGMIGLMTGGILNIGGDAFFMFKLNMGIAGAGLSTALSQIVSFSILLSMFLRGKTQVKLSIKNVTFKNHTLGNIITTGVPSLVRQGLGSLATIILNLEAASYAMDQGVAAMSIVSRVAFFLFAISLGIGQGFQPVSGFNYGAGKYSRIRSAYKITVILSASVLAVLTIAVLIAPSEIVKLFRDDEEVIVIGTRALKVLCYGQLFLPATMVTEMLMQSTGQRLSALILSSLRGGLIFIPLLLILPRIRGMYGVEEAQPLAYVLSAIPAVFMARRYFIKLPTTDLPDKDSESN